MSGSAGGSGDGDGPGLETAVLGGGCFWCTEAALRRVRGVHDVRSGYAGGHVERPSYREVCGGGTGHAEVIRVRFDPSEISYADILRVFFAVHDPTTRDRQGADVGPQYRSIILHEDEAQRDTARRVVAEIEESGELKGPIVTEIVPLERFWPAEEEHHEFYERNRSSPYCRAVIDPKIAHLARSHGDLLSSAGD